MSPGYGRITLEDTLTHKKFVTHSNNTTGEYEINIPTSTYKMSIEFEPVPNDTSHFMEKTVNINSNTTLNFQAYPHHTSRAVVWGGKTILYINKRLTKTTDAHPNHELFRAPNVQRIFLRRYNPDDSWSQPLSLVAGADRAMDSITIASHEMASYREESTDSIGGISYTYRKNKEMSTPGLDGETFPYVDLDTHILYKVDIEINKDNIDSTRSYGVHLKENVRALGFYATSPDPTSVMGTPSSSRNLNPDDKKCIWYTFCLEPGTDMSWYKEDSTVTQDISTSVNIEDISPKLSLRNYS